MLHSPFGDRFCTSDVPPEGFGRLPDAALWVPPEDRRVLRALAARKREMAGQPRMQALRALWTAANGLGMTRPPVMVDEICWNEFAQLDELRLRCEHPFARELETDLRRELFRAESGLGDMIVEPFVECPLQVYDSGFQIDEDVDILRTDPDADVVSRHFHAFIRGIDDVEKIKPPEIAVDRERTRQLAEAMEEIFGGGITVKVAGARGQWFTPWDFLIRCMGVEDTLYNLYDEPEFIEAAVQRYVECSLLRMDRYREDGIWASNNAPVRVGSGGYGLTDKLCPGEGLEQACPTRQMWGCGNAQIFSEVSPEMHWQFSLKYELEWLKQFGAAYYGCCEPLSGKMDLMDRIPNLLKVSMSPWNDFAAAAERCKGRYVMSCKPNPAVLATERFNEEQARRDIASILEKTRGCSLELIMKDISTVRHEPARLIRWAEIAREEIDRFYA